MSRDMDNIERIRAGPAQGGKRPEDMSPQELHAVLWQVLSFRDSVVKKIEKTIGTFMLHHGNFLFSDLRTQREFQALDLWLRSWWIRFPVGYFEAYNCWHADWSVPVFVFTTLEVRTLFSCILSFISLWIIVSLSSNPCFKPLLAAYRMCLAKSSIIMINMKSSTTLEQFVHSNRAFYFRC